MFAFTRENGAYFKIWAFILLNIIFFFPGFIILYDKWFWWGSYYSHGPLVVVAFVWLLFRRLNDYEPVVDNTPENLPGFIIITISILIYLIALWKNINIFAPWAIYVFIVGNSILFFGKNFIKKNIGIFIYLLLAIPIPQIIIDRLTFELNLFASYSSEICISLIYPSTLRNGNILNVNGHPIAITHECSGLSNLISMFSVVWLMALFQTRKVITFIDYFISIPAAIISNILRIVIITILVVSGYEQFALYDWHSEIGMAVFMLIVILIAVFNELPAKKQGYDFKSFSSRLKSYLYKNKKLINVYMLLMVVLVLIGLIITAKNEVVNPDNKILLKDKLPASTGRWQSQDEILGENYFGILGADDLLMRAYREKDNNDEKDAVYLYIIRSRDAISAFHRPEVCLRGEGYNLSTDDELQLLVSNEKNIPVNRLLFVDKNEGLLVYYWYYLNGRNIKDTIEYLFLFLFDIDEDSSGNFIRISKPVDLHNMDQEEQKMKKFANEVIPDLLEYL